MKDENSMKRRKVTGSVGSNEESHSDLIKSTVNLKSPKAKRWQLFRNFFIVVICCVAFVLFFDLNLKKLLPFMHKCELPMSYSIIFDAGSTGSRIHIFTFYNDSGNLLLSNDIFEEIKPGLSFYDSSPKAGAKSLVPLLNIAKESIPQEMWSSTPIVLYATAGLRLLPRNASDALLNEAATLIHSYPFRAVKNVASIINGKDEAIYGWITVNYLLGRLQDMKNTVALLDLGGGSTQITLMASDPETLKSRAHDLKTISIYGQNITLYAKSYLGHGLLEARLNILGGTKDDANLRKKKEDRLLLQSPCIVDGMSENWDHRGVKYSVHGHEEPVNRNFESCFILTIPMTYPIFKPKELKNMEIFGISYFNDRAADVGIIDLEKGGSVQVVTFHNKAVEYCGKKHNGSPFLCLDLSYITALLWKGYDLDGLREINLYKKINSAETSWCLGAALSNY